MDFDLRDCVLHKNTEGGYSLVDHSLQQTVVSGTKQEVFDFIKPYATRQDLDTLFGLDAIDLGAPLTDLDLDFLFMQGEQP